MKFTVDCKTWRFGGRTHDLEKGDTELLNDKGMMCCLGHCAKNMNIPDYELIDICYPFLIVNPQGEYFETFVKTSEYGNHFDNELSENAAKINDTFNISHKRRMNKLTELFKEHGHEIKFINIEALEVDI